MYLREAKSDLPLEENALTLDGWMLPIRSGPIERGVAKVPNDLLFYSTSGYGGGGGIT